MSRVADGADHEIVGKGIELLKKGDSLGALSFFERAYTRNNTPEAQSYFGYCIALERGQISEALKLCWDSISKDPGNPVNYLNYARVCLKANMRDDAIKNLRTGISVGENDEIKMLLEKLGLRRKPVFPFLSRSHPINKYAGLVLHRLRLR